MSFDNATNQGRVEKIIELTSHLQKSADTNQAPGDEIWEVLQPALDALSALCGAEAEPAPVRSPGPVQPIQQPIQQPKLRERPGMVIKRMAEEADLKDLTYAVAVFLNRIDEHLSKHKG